MALIFLRFSLAGSYLSAVAYRMKFIIFILFLHSISGLASNRDKWQKPVKILNAFSTLNDKSKTFCEIGAGEGYFSLKASKRFQSVYASELNDESIKKLNEKINKENISNIYVIKSKESDPLFLHGKCDIIFMSMVYHHLKNRINYLKNLKQYLAPKGRIINLDNVDDINKYDGTGKRLPSKECRFPKEQFVKEASAAKYTSIKEISVIPMQYLFEIN